MQIQSSKDMDKIDFEKKKKKKWESSHTNNEASSFVQALGELIL